MSDNNIEMKLGVDVEVKDAERLDVLRKEFEKINAELVEMARNVKAAFSSLGNLSGKGRGRVSGAAAGSADAEARSVRDALAADRDRLSELKRRWSFEARMTAQRRRDDNEAARAAREESREVERRFRDQLAFNTKVARQRAREEEQAERLIRAAVLDTARMRDRENRKAAADARRHERELHRAASGAAQGAGQVRSGAGRVAAVGGAAGLALGYGSQRAVDALTRSGVEVDKAVNSNVRLGNRTPQEAERQGAELRRRAMPIARSLGIHTAEYLRGRSEALQAGVDDEILDVVTEFGSKYARLNDMSSSEVMESSGYGITALGAFGKVTADKVKNLFNIQQHLAATTAASRQGLNAFVRRGLSAGAAAGFSVDDTLAYGGAATSSGADGEMAARMLSSTTERLASMPTKAADIGRKHHKTLKDKNLLSLPRKLGFRSWRDVKKAFSLDAAGTMEKLYEGLATVHDPRERLELSEELWGKEFGAVHAAMAVGHRFRDMRKSVRSPQAGNAIDSGMAVRSGSYDFILDQIGATVTDLKDSLGLVLKPLWADLRDWTKQAPKAFESFESAFRSGLTGLLYGLGSPDGSLGGALRRWLGDPAGFRANARAVFDFAKGFGAGLRETARNVKAVISAFAGVDANGETIGRLVARFLSLSVACLALAPVLGVLSGLTSIVVGFVGLARAAGSVLGMGAAGAAGAGVGALAGVAKLLSGGFVLALAGAIGAERGTIVTLVLDAVKPLWSAIKEGLGKAFSWQGLKDGGKAILDELVPAPVQRWLNGDEKPSSDGHWQDPPARKSFQNMGGADVQTQRSLKQIDENTRDGAKFQKQSFELQEEGGFKDLIHKAALGGVAGQAAVQLRALGLGAGIGAGVGSLGGGGGLGVGSGGGLGGSTPGESISGMSGMRRRGIIGGGGGVGASDNSPIGAFKGSQNFDSLAPRIMADLRKDFGLTKEEGAAILGNLGHESGGFRFHQEVNPRGGGRGGIGWAQWTGPRRRQYEAWCSSRGLDPRSYEANYSFLRHELQTSEKGAIGALKRANGLDGKTAAFENVFERAGVKAYGSRNRFARRALGLGDVAAGVEGTPASAGTSVPAREAAADVGRLRDIGDGIRSSGWQRREPSRISALSREWKRTAGGWFNEKTGRNATVDEARALDDSFRAAREGAGLRNASPNMGAQVPPRRPTDLTPNPAITGPPVPAQRPAGLGQSAPLRTASGGGSAGAGAGAGGPSVHAPITINSSGGDPEVLAARVQRHIADTMNRRTHDYDSHLG